MSVLFADIKGSTELVNRNDPERAFEPLGRTIDLMREAVHRFGGTVNRVQGDGIMALFGAPVECEDHAVRACGAALSMLDSMEKARSGLIPLPQIRVGVSSGEVVTLPVTSDAAVHYDAMGSVVHLAARLEQAASPGSALVAVETWQATHEAFEAHRRELKGLRGLPEIVPAFELTRWKSEKNLRRLRRILPGAFVGREAALATLRAALDSSTSVRGRVVCITGEAGVGKSRLISEFVSLASEGARVCASFASPYRTFPYGPLAELVADLAGIKVDTPPEQRRQRLGGLIQEAVGSAALDQNALATLLDVDTTASTLVSIPPLDRRLRVEAAAVALFASMSRDKPLIMIVEDVHWLDRDDLSQLTRVCNGLRNVPCLVLLSVRDSWNGASEVAKRSDYQCKLASLQAPDAAHLVSALVRPGRGMAALNREIVDRTQGNPLFIEETLHALHQLGALVRDGQAYRLQRPGVEVPLAPTVRGLLAARIDLLTNTQKDVLQAVAVIGQSATPELLRSLLDLGATIVDSAVEQLIADKLLEMKAQAPAQTALQFRHPLAREVAYEQTLLSDRVRMHKWMLARLEQEEGAGARARTDLLAEHAMRAEVWDKAAHYLLRAGNEAFWRDAKTEAVRFLLRGLEAVAQSGQDGQDSSLGLQLRLELRNPLYQLARMDELADHLAAARPLALQLSDPIHTGRYHMFQSHYYWFAGDANAALREAEAAEALAASTGVEALALRGRFQRGLVCLSRAEHRETIAIMDAVSAAILTRRPQDAFGMNRTLLVTTLGYSARARAELGDISEARANAAQSLALARQVDNQFAWVFAYLAEGWVNFRAGDPERALPFLEHAYETCLNEEVPLMAPVASSLLAMALLHSGGCSPASNPADIKRALSLAERAVEQGEEFKFGAFQPLRLAILSQALSAAGRHDDALATAMVALERARIQFEPGSEIEALFAMAQAQSSLRMDWQEPLQHALSLAGRLQMTPALAHCKKLQALCAERSPNS